MRYSILLLSIFAFFVLKSSSLNHTSNSLPLDFLDQKPIVHANLNGHLVSFMIDTGSDLTVIDESAAKSFDIKLRQLPTNRNQVAGIGTQKQQIKLATSVKLQLAGHHIFTSFVSTKLAKVNSHFRTKGKAPLVGIIGADVMQQYGFVLDYENNVLVLNF